MILVLSYVESTHWEHLLFLSTVYSQQLLLVETEVAIEKGLHLMPDKGVAKNLIENDYDRGQCNLHLCTFE